MISADYVVIQLCRMMGNAKGMFGIEWSLDREGGYRSLVNGVGLYLILIEYQWIGKGPALYLFLFKDEAKTWIVEPSIHISQAPIGKFLRMVTVSWPKPPETPEEQANERLRIALNKLHARASEQDDLRPKDAFLGKELRDAIAKGVFRQDFFYAFQDNEGVRQEFFQELLRMKPRT